MFDYRDLVRGNRALLDSSNALIDDLARKHETEQVPASSMECVEEGDLVWCDRWLRDQVWIERLPLGVVGEPHFTGPGGCRAERSGKLHVVNLLTFPIVENERII